MHVVLIGGAEIKKMCGTVCDYRDSCAELGNLDADDRVVFYQKEDNEYVFCNALFLQNVVDQVDLTNKILITHNTDASLLHYKDGEALFEYLDHSRWTVKNLWPKDWYAQNSLVTNVKPLPLGPGQGKFDLPVPIDPAPRQKDILVYKNFKVASNPKERSKCDRYVDIPNDNNHKLTQEEYYNTLAKSYFCVSPDGYGVDCHRHWEALYFNCIPIVTKNNLTEYLSRYFPMCLIDDWSLFDITQYTPELHHQMIQGFNRSYLTLNYYLSNIEDTRHNVANLGSRNPHLDSLPRVCVFGDYRERNDVPTKFVYTYQSTNDAYDVLLLQDQSIIDFVDGKITNPLNKKVVVELYEPSHMMFGEFNKVHDCVHSNYAKFDRILTYDERILKLPNAVFTNGGAEVVLNKRIGDNVHGTFADESLMRVYKGKPKLISVISSNKIMSEGHVFRLKTLQYLNNHTSTRVDFYGQTMHSHYLREVLKDIDGKIDGLKDYMFSIAIENGVCKNYFTEKILDCFLTGTIPIYHGCPNIGEFFDIRGFITFNNQEELVSIVDSLTEKDYIDRKEFLQVNFDRAMALKRTNNDFFNKYIKDLV